MNTHEIVFFFDCDNTLLDNDRIEDEIDARFNEQFGAGGGDRYWTLFEAARAEAGYADYLGALERYRSESRADTRLLEMSSFFLEYPFEERVYAGAFDVLTHCSKVGVTAILSDGDVVFQPRKIKRAGLWNAVDGRVLIYAHKEQALDDIEHQYPAEHYVIVDDKLRILTAMKGLLGERVTTIFPRQGHYAQDADALKQYPPADVSVERIGELANFDLDALREFAQKTSNTVRPHHAGQI